MFKVSLFLKSLKCSWHVQMPKILLSSVSLIGDMPQTSMPIEVGHDPL